MIEEVVDGLKTILVANLVTMLDTIDTEHGSDFTLDDIPASRIFTYDPLIIQTAPAIVILAQGSPPNQMISGTSYSPNDFIHSIFLVCLAAHTNEERLTRTSFRYLDALWRIIKANPKLGLNAVFDTTIVDHAHSNFYKKEGGYRKDLYLKLSVRERITV